MKNKNPLIVAVDVETFEEARELIDILSPVVDTFKVGSQLFTACGPVVIRHILAKGKDVFLDLKFHDIPNTVGNAVAAAVGLGSAVHQVLDENKTAVESKKGLFMITLHTIGGEEMLRKAVTEATKKAQNTGVTKPLLVGITVLTSDPKTDNISDLIKERAQLAQAAGLDGVVASAHEASLIREVCGEDFVIVTPGIRPEGTDAGDQKRVGTPSYAIEQGSNFLVVGRPIVKADDPLQSAKDILKQIKEVQK